MVGEGSTLTPTIPNMSEEDIAMGVSAGVSKLQGSLPTAYYDTVILGAGPYGLSVAAHLRAKALRVVVFGKPLQLWRNNMPQGMLLRSYWWASNLSDPQ